MTITTVISDFGGVLTTPLVQSFAAVQEETGLSFEDLGGAMQEIATREGEHPLFELEKGVMSESDFHAKLEAELETRLGRRPTLRRFSELYFEALNPNEQMIGLMRELKDSGLRMALLTNNVREWESRWRAMMPIDEIFEVVVDSAFVGCRKPEPEIYEITLERLGNGVHPRDCLFIDDLPHNCEAAAALGMTAVHYQDNEQAIPEIRASLGIESGPAR